MDYLDTDLIGELDKGITSIKLAKADISKELLDAVRELDSIINHLRISKEVRKSLYKVCEKLEDLEFSVNPPPAPKNPLF